MLKKKKNRLKIFQEQQQNNFYIFFYNFQLNEPKKFSQEKNTVAKEKLSITN